MEFSHGKWIRESINISATDLTMEICPSFCNPTNRDGFCPTPCLSHCSSICRFPFTLISSPDPPTSSSIDDQPGKTHKVFLYLVLTLSILATIFLLVCSYAIYVKYYSRRRRSQSQQPQPDEIHDQFLDEEHGPVLDHPIWYIHTVGLQPSVISAITVCKYKRGDGLVEGTECAVCLSEFEEDETLRLLPKCNHAFHIPCIDTWLRSHTNCPMCRAGIVASTAGSPSPEVIVSSSDSGEETRVAILENNNEIGRDRADGVGDLRSDTEEEGDLHVENEGRRHEHQKEEVDEVQPMRRSVSLDSISASKISLDVAHAFPIESDGNSDNQLEKENTSNMRIVPKRVNGNHSLLRIVGSSSMGRSLQYGSSSMKRSFSCSGKFLLSWNSQSRNSVLPL